MVQRLSNDDELDDKEVVVDDYDYEVVVCDDSDGSIRDEDYLASIQSSIRKEFDARNDAKVKQETNQVVDDVISTTMKERGEVTSRGDEEEEDAVTEDILQVSQQLDSVVIEEEIVVDYYDSLRDEDFLTSIQSSIRNEFEMRKAKTNRDSAPNALGGGEKNGNNNVELIGEEEEEIVMEEILENSQGSIRIEEEIVEDDEDVIDDPCEYEEQIIEKWFQVESVPDDLEAACRQLIPIVYKGEDHIDAESMMRRTPLPELYKYLKQHYDYKKDVKKEICDDVGGDRSDTSQQGSLQALFQKRAAAVVEKENVRECNTRGSQIEYKQAGVQRGNEISISKSSTKVSNSDGDDGDTSGTCDEDLIDEWVERAGFVPEDLKMACMKLVRVVYKDDVVDVEKLIRRTPLLELYGELKQSYMHARDRAKDASKDFRQTKMDSYQSENQSVVFDHTTIDGPKEPANEEIESLCEETLGESMANFTSFLPDESVVYEEVIENSLRDVTHGSAVVVDESWGKDIPGAFNASSVQYQLGESMRSYYEEVVDMGMSVRSFIEEEVIEEEAESITEEGANQEESFVYEDVDVGFERSGSL